MSFWRGDKLIWGGDLVHHRRLMDGDGFHLRVDDHKLGTWLSVVILLYQCDQCRGMDVCLARCRLILGDDLVHHVLGGA